MNRAHAEALRTEAAFASDERNGPCRFRPNAKQYEVCPCCGGSGTVVNPSIDCRGLSHEDFCEDPDFLEDYCSGVYDIRCNVCDGNRVIDPDHEPEERGWNPWNDPESRGELLMGA